MSMIVIKPINDDPTIDAINDEDIPKTNLILPAGIDEHVNLTGITTDRSTNWKRF
jgi:dihydroorotase-like cyclic amidohydrolase